MDQVVIGIDQNFSKGLEDLLEHRQYDKYSRSTGMYFSFKTPNWNEPTETEADSIMQYLLQHVGNDNFSLVRAGKEPDDIDVYGDIDRFDININKAIVFAESYT